MDNISDKELFDSALNDQPAEAPEQEISTEGDSRQRDEQGRFAAKADEPVPEPKADVQATEQPKEAESVGMRQLREAYERQARQTAELQQQLQALRPKPEAAPKPDIFENPDQFLKAGITEALSPIEQQFATFIETVSRKDAIREHGQERVSEAFSALDRAASAGDPQAMAVVQAVKKSMDPFGEIVGWYAGNEASRNPEGFFQRKLEEALKDEKFKGELMAKLQPVAEQQSTKSVFKLPPSLSRLPASQSASEDIGDLSDPSLFAYAMR